MNRKQIVVVIKQHLPDAEDDIDIWDAREENNARFYGYFPTLENALREVKKILVGWAIDVTFRIIPFAEPGDPTFRIEESVE